MQNIQKQNQGEFDSDSSAEFYSRKHPMSSLVLEVRFLWHHNGVVLAAQDQRLLGNLAGKWDTLWNPDCRSQQQSCGRAGSSSHLHSSISPSWGGNTVLHYMHQLFGAKRPNLDPKHNYQRAGEWRMLCMGKGGCRIWCIWANSCSQGWCWRAPCSLKQPGVAFRLGAGTQHKGGKDQEGGEEPWSQRKWAKNEKKPKRVRSKRRSHWSGFSGRWSPPSPSSTFNHPWCNFTKANSI